MTILFDYIDGFDSYGDASHLQSGNAWPGVLPGSGITLQTGRNGYKQSIQFQGSSGLTHLISGGATQLQCGASFNRFNETFGLTPVFSCRAVRTGTGSDDSIISLCINDIGRLVVSLGAANVLPVAFASKSVGINQWNYIEWAVKFGAEDGEVRVWLNGGLVLEEIGFDTRPRYDSAYTGDHPSAALAAPEYSSVSISGDFGTSFSLKRYDDYYVGTYAGVPEPLGDSRIYSLVPDATFSSSWAAVGGATVHAVIADNNDATYAQANIIGDDFFVSTSEIWTVPPNNIHAVQVNARISKTDAATRAVKAVVGIDGGAIIESDYEAFLAQQPNAESFIFPENPETDLPWVAIDFEDFIFGLRITE